MITIIKIIIINIFCLIFNNAYTIAPFKRKKTTTTTPLIDQVHICETQTRTRWPLFFLVELEVCNVCRQDLWGRCRNSSIFLNLLNRSFENDAEIRILMAACLHVDALQAHRVRSRGVFGNCFFILLLLLLFFFSRYCPTDPEFRCHTMQHNFINRLLRFKNVYISDYKLHRSILCSSGCGNDAQTGLLE